MKTNSFLFFIHNKNMIENYKIENNTLYLYLSYDYEFSSEFGIFEKVSEYIKDMKINLKKGMKIVLVSGGIILGTLLYHPDKNILENKYITSTLLPGYSIVNNTNKEEPKEEIKEENITNEVVVSTPVQEEQQIQNNPQPVEEVKPIVEETTKNEITVYRRNGEIINLSMNDYLIGVVGSEMPAEFHLEALKAGAIAARTYALKKIEEGGILTDTVSTQAYSDNNELQQKWGSSFDKYYNKIKQAVSETDNLVIKYQGSLINAMYFSTSNGYTESAKEVFGYDIPYLQSVESSVDLETTPYLRTIEKSELDILNILGVTNLNNIEVLSRTSSGRVKEIKIDNKIYTGIELRNLLGLRSTDFDISVNNGTATITTRGYGHGVGMSQYGANKLAQKGYNYKDILKHYYINTEITSV